MAIAFLPPQLTAFIGRTNEIADVTNRLDEPSCRLLTLIGPGGIGKTRLAIEVASHRLDRFPDGIYFVELQPVTSPDHIVPAVANAIKFTFYEGIPPTEQLLQYLHDKRLLLIMDNFEHLLSGYDFVTEILNHATNLKLLVTSREALNLQGEWIYAVAGLSFPDNHEQYQPDYDAVRLFDSRARQVSSDFSLEDEWPHVVEICRLVEGTPLAIELAATWLKSLSCEASAQQIRQDLDFLVTPLRDIPERHRSMRAVFEHSWTMLSPEEKAVFMKLTVFRGGCADDAARQVTGASLFTVSGLVDKSFARKAESGRYVIHELLRQFGMERLELSGQAELARLMHSDYYLNALGQREADIKGNRQLAALDEIESDFENIRAAWEWAVERKRFELIRDALEGLYWFCVSRNRLHEGADLIQVAVQQLPEALDAPAAHLQSRLQACHVAMLALGYIQDENAPAHLEESLGIAQQYDDQAAMAFCLMVSAEVALKAREYRVALSLYRQTLKYYRQRSDSFYMGRILERVSFVTLASGGPIASAVEAAQEGLTLAREIGDKVGIANCQYVLGGALGALGNYAEYKAAYREALAIRRETREQAGIALNLGGLAHAEFFAGNFSDTMAFASEAFTIASKLNYLEGKCQALNWLGHLACMEEDYDESRRLLEEARLLATDLYKAASAELGLALVACALWDYERAQEHLQNALELIPFRPHYAIFHILLVIALLLVAEGQTTRGLELLSLLHDQPVYVVGFIPKWPFIPRLQADLRAALGDNVYTRTWEHGKTLELNMIAAEMFEYFSPTYEDRTSPTSSTIPEAMRSTNRTLPIPLTARETEILTLIAQGLSNRQIADQLFIAESTVKRHINNCYGKLSVTSRTQAILRAQQLKLV